MLIFCVVSSGRFSLQFKCLGMTNLFLIVQTSCLAILTLTLTPTPTSLILMCNLFDITSCSSMRIYQCCTFSGSFSNYSSITGCRNMGEFSVTWSYTTGQHQLNFKVLKWRLWPMDYGRWQGLPCSSLQLEVLTASFFPTYLNKMRTLLVRIADPELGHST